MWDKLLNASLEMGFCSLTLFSNNLAVVLRVVICENVVYASACLIFSLVFKLKEQFLLYQADTSE